MSMSSQREINSRIPLTEATPATVGAADVVDPTSNVNVGEKARGDEKALSDVTSRDSKYLRLHSESVISTHITC